MSFLKLLKVCACLGVLFLLVGPAAAAITPEQVHDWWSPQVVVAMVLFGVAVKYWPPLAAWRNSAIGWLNTGLYILTSLAAPAVVAAGVFGNVLGSPVTFSLLDTLIHATVHSASAMVLYETLGRHALEGWLGMRKSVPKPAPPSPPAGPVSLAPAAA